MLVQRLFEDERRSCAGWRQQRIKDGPRTISGARRLQRLTNTSILDLRDLEADGRADDRAFRWWIEAMKEASWSQREGSPKIVVLKGADHAVDIGRPGADRLRDIAPCGGDRSDLFYDGAGLRES